MNILYSKKFLKDIEQLNERKIRRNIEDVINQIKDSHSLAELNSVRKMVGYDNYYRIRIGNYRLGLKSENSTVTMLRFKHRKDIYDVFP